LPVQSLSCVSVAGPPDLPRKTDLNLQAPTKAQGSATEGEDGRGERAA